MDSLRKVTSSKAAPTIQKELIMQALLGFGELMDGMSGKRVKKQARPQLARGNPPMNTRFADQLGAQLRTFSVATTISTFEAASMDYVYAL